LNCEEGTGGASLVCDIAVVTISFDGISDGIYIMWKNIVVDPLAFFSLL